MPKREEPKEVRYRQGFAKNEKRVVERVVMSEAMSQEIEEASLADSKSKSAFMGKIIRDYLKQRKTKK